MPGVIVVLTFVIFVDHLKTDSIAYLMIKIVADLEHIVPEPCGKLSFPIDNFLDLRHLLIAFKVVGMLPARTLVTVLHLKFFIMTCKHL